MISTKLVRVAVLNTKREAVCKICASQEIVTDGRVYLDHNATAPLRIEAREAMLAALDLAGAASSIHAEGRAARTLIEAAREHVAALAGVDAEAVIFTSGASEANSMALSPSWALAGTPLEFGACLISSLEHPSVLAGGRFPQAAVRRFGASRDGIFDIADLKDRLDEAKRGGLRPFVSAMAANNETGAVQPLSGLAEVVRTQGGIVHSDAAQAAGKIPIEDLPADLITLSSHKLGGPLGAGAVIVKTRALHLADPLIRGGGQEKGARAGTENIAAIAGFGAAAAAARRDLAKEAARLSLLRDRFEAGLREMAPGLMVFAEATPRLPNTSLFAVPGLSAAIAVIRLDLDGIAISSGSACSSGKVGASHVLQAMGLSADIAGGALRVSLGPTTGEADIERCLLALSRLIQSLDCKPGSKAA